MKEGEGNEPMAPVNPPDPKSMESVWMAEGIGGTEGACGNANCVKSGVEGCSGAEVFF